MPSCAGFLEHRKWRLGPSKSTLNAENFLFPFPCLSQSISAQFALKMCLAARNRQKSIKLLFWRSRLSEVIDFGANREPVHDFLLVINSNLGRISHHFWDMATCWLKIAIFFYLLSFSASAWGDSFRIYRKALRILKLESVGQPTAKIW